MNLLPKNEPVQRLLNQKIDIWVYGEPQAGKTTFAATFPHALILSTDGNFKTTTCPAVHIMTAYQVVTSAGIPIIKTGWEYVRDLVKELIATPNYGGYQTVIVDLIEDFYELCRQHWIQKLGVTHESEVEWSRGYEMVRNDFFGFIRDLKSLPLNLVMISHTKDTSNQKGISKTRPNITQKLQNKIGGYVDLVGYIYKATTPEGVIQVGLQLDSVEPFASNRWNISSPSAILANYDALVQTIVQAYTK